MRVSWNLVGKLIELGFDAAMAIDRWLDRRKQKPRAPSVGEALRARRERMNAETRVVRKDTPRAPRD